MSTIDDNVLRQALQQSPSMRAAAKLLNINYKTLRHRAKQLGLFNPNQGGKGRNWSPNKKPANEVLIERSDRKKSHRHMLCRALLEIGRKYECVECGLGPRWNERVLQLQVDHVNGLNYDNRQENLRFLCPNCHSQTPTFGNKGDQKRYATVLELGRQATLRTWCPQGRGGSNPSGSTMSNPKPATCRWFAVV